MMRDRANGMDTTPCNCHICILADKKEEITRNTSVNRDFLIRKLVGYKLSGNSEVFSLGVDDAQRIVDYLIENI